MPASRQPHPLPDFISPASHREWYVLRDLKRSNSRMRGYRLLQDLLGNQAEVFTPLVQRTFLRKGRRELVDVPFISDLLFVKAYRTQLDPIIEATPFLQYRFVKGCRWNDPMTVRSEEMQRFMNVVRGHSPYRYYRPEEVTPKLYGQTITIVGGELDGMEGRLMTVRGSKTRRLIVELQGLLAVGVEVHPDYIRLVSH